MKRNILLLLLCMLIYPLAAQEQNEKVKIKHSDRFYILKTGVNRLIGNVELLHKDIVMTCDSMYQYPDSNYVEAFGNVHVVQNDTLNLWGDFMTYNANTEQVKVRQNVTLKNPQLTLTTNFLDYDAASRIGHYFNKGTIRDSVNTLISDIGYYYMAINEMFFKDSVQVYNPSYTLYSDTLKYQTVTKVITILGPTYIYGDNRTLYSEDGWYNSLTSHAELYKNNKLTYNEYYGRSDTLVVDSISGTAIMRQNVHLFDTVNNVIVEGNYGEVLKNNDYAFVTEKALLTMVGNPDSLFVHGDTLSLSKDSIGNNIMKAYYNTKFFNPELQGLCDSMTFLTVDSTVYLHGNPIVWASGNQMTGTEITMHMKDNEVDRFNINSKAMIINPLDSTKFNQIKGRNMTGYVQKNELYLVDVNGNGEVLYYPDDKGVIIGLNKTISSTIKIQLVQKKVNRIVFITKPEGQLNPLFLVKKEDRFLKDFNWYIHLKPLKKEDIFIK